MFGIFQIYIPHIYVCIFQTYITTFFYILSIKYEKRKHYFIFHVSHPGWDGVKGIYIYGSGRIQLSNNIYMQVKLIVYLYSNLFLYFINKALETSKLFHFQFFKKRKK